MQFGVREICDVVFKAKTAGTLGNMNYVAGQPILYIDTAKTSTLEGAASTVYATGGKGNSRLIAWEGEKTITFTVEDALLSEVGFAVLSGAGLFQHATGVSEPVYVHTTAQAQVGADTAGTGIEIDLTDALGTDEQISKKSPVFAMVMEHGNNKKMISGLTVDTTGKKLTKAEDATDSGAIVFVDFYVEKTTGVTELVIDAENFAGYYYVEASTLFRRQSDGKDLPAEIIFPNVKVQSNFTFSMAPTGDPSTFTFTMDAMPGYTRFDRSKKVLVVMQVIDDSVDADADKSDSVGNDADAELTYPISGE